LLVPAIKLPVGDEALTKVVKQQLWNHKYHYFV
jgi:hypothetical protein